ncbi:hypothetical protein [Pseudanabaena yagii]|uniref:Uncharacterized protein n=1 Tax=Pseudanabaena yagii GIHE-NHR1 TaxID=2722753 RepID=A0ABX1LVR5_9CYAN|nr:hypothetical protein [Pseudanabaena yagii]NMF59353.1 hypothetical protein [Pseudanabaena yagii GIHE-NHR1]
MKFQGQIPNHDEAFYTNFLLPIVWLKRGLESIQKYINNVIWSELIAGETLDNDFLNFILFIVFCLLSIATYRFQHYHIQIIFICSIIWYLDKIFTQQRYFNSKKKTITSLVHTKDGNVAWSMTSSQGETRQLKFHENNINYIHIKSIVFVGGAFKEPIANAWQVAICLNDDQKLLMYEEFSSIDAINHALELADHFNIYLKFDDSEGYTNYTDQDIHTIINSPDKLSRKIVGSNSIKLTKTAKNWHIYFYWTINNSWKFFGKVLHDSGFLLFVLIISRFMSRFGEMLDTMIAYYKAEQVIYLNFNGILGVFTNPQLSVNDWLGIMSAIALIIIRGAQISQSKHIYIDKHQLKGIVNKLRLPIMTTVKAKEVHHFNLHDVKGVVFIKKPEPLFLIYDRKQALEISDLFQEKDYRSLLNNTEDAIAYFKSK